MKHTFMRMSAVLLALLLTGRICQAASQASITLAKDGQTTFQIVTATDASTTDQYAADVLTQYLHQATGATFTKASEDQLAAGQRAIFVGLGYKARARLGQMDSFKLAGKEAFACRMHEGDLYLHGRGIHGNLNAVMHFLRTQVGFRWYTVFDPPVVPSHRTLTIHALNERGDFSFASRRISLRWDIDFFYQHGVNEGYEERRAYKADQPYHSWLPTTEFVHTAFSYIPPDDQNVYVRRFAWQDRFDYFETNPEFFSLNQHGQRVDDMQLCYANPALRAELTRNVLRDIQANQERVLITMDAADNPGKFCHCEGCVALESKYQSPGGPLYDYVLQLCGELKQSHPQTMVRLLAYRRSQTQKPPVLPQGQMLPENLVVSFAPIEDNYFADWTHPDEAIQETYDDLKAWGRISHHLWAWIYPNPFGTGAFMPVGNVERLITNIRLMHEAGVTGLFADHRGYLSRSGFSELQQYLMFKLMADVNCDTAAIIREFTDDQYGKAGPLVRQYLNELERSRRAMKTLPPGVNFRSSFYDEKTFPYLTAANIQRWQAFFDQMLALVVSGSKEAGNVKLLRRELDFATLHRWNELAKLDPETYAQYGDFIQRIRTANGLASARKEIKPRALGTGELEDLDLALSMQGREKPLPPQFRDIDPSRIRTYLPQTQRRWTLPKADPDAPFGYAATVHQPQSPFRAGYCQWRSRTPSVTDRGPDIEITRDRITPGQYTLYRIGTIQVDVHDALIWFGRSWATHLQVGQRLYIPGERNLWDTYVSLKFDGPSYGGQGEEDEVLVGRIILVSVDAPDETAIP